MVTRNDYFVFIRESFEPLSEILILLLAGHAGEVTSVDENVTRWHFGRVEIFVFVMGV